MAKAISGVQPESQYPLLSSRASYQELGGVHFDLQKVKAQRSQLIHRPEAFGVKVTIEALPVAA